MINPLDLQKLRAALRGAVRGFFGGLDYLEVETPIAVVCPGTEVHLRYWQTRWRDFRGHEWPLYLRSSPELHMKQLVASGGTRIFQMGPCFRSGGELSASHHPEFTMLEWYQTEISFNDFMAQTEDLLRSTHDQMAPVIKSLTGLDPNPCPPSFERITVAEAFRTWAQIELVDLDPDLAMRAIKAGVASVNDDDDFETAFFKILLERVEPALSHVGACILYDYPASQAALAKVEDGVAKRFEVYLSGMELSNGFQELLDPQINRQRIADANCKRQDLGYEVAAEDEDFYHALNEGLPPCCGNALGLDRLLVRLLGCSDLGEVIPFRRAQPYRNHL